MRPDKTRLDHMITNKNWLHRMKSGMTRSDNIRPGKTKSDQMRPD